MVKSPFAGRVVAVGILVGVPVSAALLILAARGLQPHQVLDSLGRAHLAGLLVAVGCIGVMAALQARRWQQIGAAAGMRLPWRSFLRMVICGVAVNNVVPGRVGDMARSYWLSRDSGGPGPSALSTVVVDRTTDLLVLIVAAVLSYPFVPHPAWSQHVLEAAAAGGLVLVAALGITRIYAARTRADRLREGRPRWRWLLRRSIAEAAGVVAATVNRRDLPRISVLAILAWTAFAAAAWSVGQSLGISLSVSDLAFMTAVVNLGVAIPSAPGFVGSYQWLCVASLGLAGIGRPQAFAYSILLQASWYVPMTAVGLVLLLLDVGGSRPQRAPRVEAYDAQPAGSRPIP